MHDDQNFKRILGAMKIQKDLEAADSTMTPSTASVEKPPALCRFLPGPNNAPGRRGCAIRGRLRTGYCSSEKQRQRPGR